MVRQVTEKIIRSSKKRPVNLILMVVVCMLYSVNNYWFKKSTVDVVQYFFVCYFNDLLCPLFFMAYSNFLLLMEGKELKTLWETGRLCFAAGIVWEYFAPVLKPEAVSDPIDLGCYLVGGCLYWGILRMVRRNETNEGERLNEGTENFG